MKDIVNHEHVLGTIKRMNAVFGRGDVLRLEWTSPLGGKVVIGIRYSQNTLTESMPFSFRCSKVYPSGKVYVTYRSRKRLVTNRF